MGRGVTALLLLVPIIVSYTCWVGRGGIRRYFPRTWSCVLGFGCLRPPVPGCTSSILVRCLRGALVLAIYSLVVNCSLLHRE